MPYDPKAVEARLYERWEESGYFHADPDPARPPFIICMPPPNVTARAHIGHGSTYAPMDVLVRYHRMLGDNADWLPGTDHAAIATEAVLVRSLAREGTSREELGRERYLERAWAWAREYGGTIERQFRALGFGPDWHRSRFTMDERLSAAVRKAFVRLYRDGLIYRGKRLVNWDPQAQTTISDAEIERAERDGTLLFVRYPASNGSRGIVVATTRPETMLADVAVAVHPNDDRYRGLIGTHVLAPPLLERRIPIVADEAVDPEFGTGAVKVTPAHDATDYEIGERHGLPMPSAIDRDGRITGNEIPAGPYAGMERFEARARVARDLAAAGLLERQEPHRHAIALSERTGAVIEPLLSEQWFVKAAPLAQPALEAYRSGRIRFVQARYGRTYEQWLENIRDWNVSRQVWWGHRLPVWYSKDGEVVVAETEAEAAQIALVRNLGELAQDLDTLDTWFSSGLWPFSILGWPERTPELACWYPSQVLVTGGEIVFLWVARMVMLGIHLMGEVPFKEVFITPLVFDAQGRKMSKSLGNAIDPMDLVERYGADAFRLGMLRQLRIESQEVRFHESRCEEARNFNNKVWNATRYAQSLPEGLPTALTLPPSDALTLADRWILTRLHDAVVDVTRLLQAYDLGVAADRMWQFVWYDVCDWYVEATKPEGARRTRAAVLSFVLNNALRLLHPAVPFVSEELWLSLPHDGDTVMTAAWPDPEEIPVDRAAEARMEYVKEAIVGIRHRRAELRSEPRERLRVRVRSGSFSAEEIELVQHLAVATVEETETVPGDAAFAAVPDAGHVERERIRLGKEAERLSAEVARGERKLANEQFVAHARPDVVAKERAKLDAYRTDLRRAEDALNELAQ